MIINEVVTALFILVVIGIVYYMMLRPKIEKLESTIKSQEEKIDDLNKRLRWFEDKLIAAGIKGSFD